MSRTEEQKRIRKVRDALRRKGHALRNNGHMKAGSKRAPLSRQPLAALLSHGWIETQDGTRLSLFAILDASGMPVAGIADHGGYAINLTLEEVEQCAVGAIAGTSQEHRRNN